MVEMFSTPFIIPATQVQDTQLPKTQPNEDHGMNFIFNDYLCDDLSQKWVWLISLTVMMIKILYMVLMFKMVMLPPCVNGATYGSLFANSMHVTFQMQLHIRVAYDQMIIMRFEMKMFFQIDLLSFPHQALLKYSRSTNFLQVSKTFKTNWAFMQSRTILMLGWKNPTQNTLMLDALMWKLCAMLMSWTKFWLIRVYIPSHTCNLNIMHRDHQ